MNTMELLDTEINVPEYESRIEAVLFALAEKVSLDDLSNAITLDKSTTKALVDIMIVKYKNSNRGIMIVEVADGYQLCTKPDYHEYIKTLVAPKQKQALSPAALETLAVIAYNGPITKANIEQVRGTNSDSLIVRLLERDLIQEAGRLDAPGKPLLYQVTDEFFRAFGIKSIDQLPQL